MLIDTIHSQVLIGSIGDNAEQIYRGSEWVGEVKHCIGGDSGIADVERERERCVARRISEAPLGGQKKATKSSPARVMSNW